MNNAIIKYILVLRKIHKGEFIWRRNKKNHVGHYG